MRSVDCFEKILCLLRCELWGEPLACKVTADDIDGILAMAEEQGVSGLVANAIIGSNLPIGEEKTVDVCTVQRLHELKCRDMDKMVGRFAGFLNRRELKYVVMKGQMMAALYPHPQMRSCGDIDFFCPKESFGEVQKVIEERLGVEMQHNEKEKHDTFKLEDIHFEMHRYLTGLSSSKHKRYWEKEIEGNRDYFSCHQEINGVKVATCSPTLNALFIFVHLFRHFTAEGEGLRHFCDWAMVLHRGRGEIDVKELEKHLVNIGCYKAYRVMGSWLVNILGLPREDFPFPFEKEDAKWHSVISNNIVKMGNLGKKDKKDAKEGHNFINRLSIWVAMKQAATFYPLAPEEILKRIPRMIAFSAKLRLSRLFP